jgi:hypothetical protein
MAEVRNCEQCDVVFAPRRGHARFCSARCRDAWNREHARRHPAQATALSWSITAMRDVTGRLWRARAGDQARAVAAVSEAVWWVTIVDATLVRHHPDAYDQVLASQTPPQRQLLENTLAGLRFVRNQMGHHCDPADFVCPAPGRPRGDKDRISTWIGYHCPSRDSPRFRPAGGHGSESDTTHTRLSSPVSPSGRSSAGPWRSSSWSPPIRTCLTNTIAPPHAESAASQ